MQSNMTMKNHIKSCNVRWMLHGNVSRSGYGNAMIGRYVVCFEEDIMRLMCERAYHLTRFGCTGEVCTSSLDEKRAMHGTEEASKIWIGGSAKNRILALVKRTHPLIIGISKSNQENTNDHVSQEECMGVWLSLHLDPSYARVTYSHRIGNDQLRRHSSQLFFTF